MTNTNGGARVTVSIRLRPDDVDRLQELAQEAGMKKAGIAAALLEELLPTITGVRRRLQIIRKEPAK